MKLILIKSIKIDKTLRDIDYEFEVADYLGEIYINMKFAKEVKDDNLKAKDVIALIEACETIEDLKIYESDERATVKAAYNIKLQSFE